MIQATRKGRRLEHQSRRLLEAAGFEVVRSAGSKGTFDLAAFSRVGVTLVQVKAGRLPSPAEREALSLFPSPPTTTKLIHVWMPRQSKPRVVEV